MAVIIENAPVIFQCNKCAWFGASFAEMADHAGTHAKYYMPADVVNFAMGPGSLVVGNPPPTVPLDLTHRPARPVVSRAKRRVAGEIELAPSESVGDVGRRVKG